MVPVTPAGDTFDIKQEPSNLTLDLTLGEQCLAGVGKESGSRAGAIPQMALGGVGERWPRARPSNRGKGQPRR